MKISKAFICIFIFFIPVSELGAQTVSLEIDSASLKSDANKMLEAFMKGDYETFIKYNYPGVVDLMGGETKMIDMLSMSIERMKAEGFTIDSCSAGEIGQSVMAGDEIHVLIPQHLVLRSTKGLLYANTFLLAISKTGNKWYFVDAGNLTPEKIRLIFPKFNSALKIPAKQPPTFKDF